MEFINDHKILAIDKRASQDDIKKAYRKLENYTQTSTQMTKRHNKNFSK